MVTSPPAREGPAPVAPNARWGRALLYIALLGAFVFAPVTFCPLRTWMHVPCPGCGATRAVLLALHRDWHGSFRMHPMAIPAALLVLPTLFYFARSIAHDQPAPKLPRPLRMGWTVLVTLLVVLWIARFFGYFGGPAPI